MAYRSDKKTLGLHQEKQTSGRKEKTLINADDALKAVFGSKKQRREEELDNPWRLSPPQPSKMSDGGKDSSQKSRRSLR
jgi:hypothetical protein